MAKIIDFLKLPFQNNKSLSLALVVSLLAHILLISKFRFNLPELEKGVQTMEVSLIRLQPGINKAPEPINDPPKPATTAKPATSTPELPAANKTSVATNKPVKQKELPAVSPEIPEAINPQTVDRSNSNASREAIAEDPETTETGDNSRLVDVERQPIAPGYKYVESEYEVQYNKGENSLSTTRVIFNLDKNGTYTLTSVTETKGQARSKPDALIQKSEGIVTDQGLIPSYFYNQRGDDPNKSQSARFYWAEGTLQLDSGKVTLKENLSVGTQDALSHKYQFMFSPPLADMEITLTDGQFLRTDHYEYQGENLLTTELGELKTIHLFQSADEEETELWLAVDYQYLPVKIKRKKRDGSIVEERITSIYTAIP